MYLGILFTGTIQYFAKKNDKDVYFRAYQIINELIICKYYDGHCVFMTTIHLSLQMYIKVPGETSRRHLLGHTNDWSQAT